MRISEIIAELEAFEDQHGDMVVELDSGIAVSEVDLVYTEDNHGSKPVAVAIK